MIGIPKIPSSSFHFGGGDEGKVEIWVSCNSPHFEIIYDSCIEIPRNKIEELADILCIEDLDGLEDNLIGCFLMARETGFRCEILICYFSSKPEALEAVNDANSLSICVEVSTGGVIANILPFYFSLDGKGV